jgi:hypothetical protein
LTPGRGGAREHGVELVFILEAEQVAMAVNQIHT